MTLMPPSGVGGVRRSAAEPEVRSEDGAAAVRGQMRRLQSVVRTAVQLQAATRASVGHQQGVQDGWGGLQEDWKLLEKYGRAPPPGGGGAASLWIGRRLDCESCRQRGELRPRAAPLGAVRKND